VSYARQYGVSTPAVGVMPSGRHALWSVAAASEFKGRPTIAAAVARSAAAMIEDLVRVRRTSKELLQGPRSDVRNCRLILSKLSS
jgi:hypothetical protein